MAESPKSPAASIFQSNIAETSEAIGKKGTIGRIANELFGKALITREFIADLDSTGGVSAADKGRKLAHNLYDTLSSRDDSDNVLTIICDILIKQQDNRLKKLGNTMKKELNEATGSSDAAAISKESTMEGKGSDAAVEAKCREDVDVKKLVKELKSVTLSRYASITGLPKENLRKVADGMFTRGIIGIGVNEEPTYNAIISEFEAGLGCYKTVAEVEEHCKKFLSALEAVGGGVAIKAKQLREGWIEGVEANLNYKLKINQ